MAERLFNLPETKGSFQLCGITNGTQKDGFLREMQTRNGKNMKFINFGVDYFTGERLYVNMTGIEQDRVYFSKRDKDSGKTVTKPINWSDRFRFNEDGFRLIGKNIGVKKVVNEKGELVNDKKVLTDYDACTEVANNLKDDASVFIRGNLEFRSYVNKNGDKVASVNLTPMQISLCSNDLDFEKEGFETTNHFAQTIIFMGLEPEVDDDGKRTERAILSAKIVTYSTIEDAEFIVIGKKLINLMRKNLKPYNSIKVSGHIVSRTLTEVVDEEDEWGESDKMERVVSPTKREFIITGAKGSTLDKETYTEQNVNEAIASINASRNAENQFASKVDDSEWDDDDDEVW